MQKTLLTTKNEFRGTVYIVEVIQPENVRETAEDKIIRLLKNCVSEKVKTLETSQISEEMC